MDPRLSGIDERINMLSQSINSNNQQHQVGNQGYIGGNFEVPQAPNKDLLFRILSDYEEGKFELIALNIIYDNLVTYFNHPYLSIDEKIATKQRIEKIEARLQELMPKPVVNQPQITSSEQTYIKPALSRNLTNSALESILTAYNVDITTAGNKDDLLQIAQENGFEVTL